MNADLGKDAVLFVQVGSLSIETRERFSKDFSA